MTPGLQHARLLCPLLSPRVCSNLCPLSQWYYLPISSSAAHFSFCLQSFPASPHSWCMCVFSLWGIIFGMTVLKFYPWIIVPWPKCVREHPNQCVTTPCERLGGAVGWCGKSKGGVCPGQEGVGSTPEPHLPLDKATYSTFGNKPQIMHPQGFCSHASSWPLCSENLFSYNCLMIIHLTNDWMRNGIIQFYTSNLKAWIK